MPLKVYHYKNCTTCRKALAFLEREGVDYQPIDIVTKPPSLGELKQILTLTGLPIKKLFNTSGQSYREGKFGERLPKLSDSEALQELAKDGKLIKRPLILEKDFALVGFDESAYREHLRGR